MLFTLVLAATLVVNAVQALMGQAVFAWWHLGTLLIGVSMTRVHLTDRQLARIVVMFRIFRKKAAKTISCIIRAVRSLPAHFVDEYNHLQTEP